VRTIDNFSRIVMDEYAQMFPAEVRKYLSMIRGSAAELDRLLSSILNCSRSSSAASGKTATTS
jgi:signal transduction histidine kinase